MRISVLTILTLVLTGLASAPRAQNASIDEALNRRDYSQAAGLLEPLARDGDARAQYELGVLYVNGDGVAVDTGEAARLFRAAAQSGNPAARQQLAFMRDTGMLPPDAPTVADGWRVQVATVANEDAARAEWRRWQKRFADVLSHIPLLTQPFAQPDGSTVFRVQGGPLTEAQAREACGRLRQLSAGCMLVKPTT